MRFLSRNFFYITSFLIIIILIYILYKSEIVSLGKKRDYYEIYFYFLAIFLFINLIILFLPHVYQTYFKILILSLIITAYLFEGYININGGLSAREKKERIFKYKELTGKNYDTRTKIQIYNDLNKENDLYKLNITWPTIINNKDEYDNIDLKKLENFLPLSGFSNSKIIHCNENGYYSIYDSDRYGFNNPDVEWNKKTIKYLLIGDSFAHGACVNRPYDISSVLRQLSKQGVINLGQDYTGPLIMYARLREYLSKNVENILWFYYEGNDYDDLNKELQIDILQNYLNNDIFNQQLIDRQNEVDLYSSKIFKNLNKIKAPVDKNNRDFSIIKFIKLFQTRWYIYRLYFLRELNQNPTEHLNQNFKKILTLANQLAKENNSQLYFIHLPVGTRYASLINRFKKNDQFISKMLNELNIPYINLDKELFSLQGNPRDLFSFNQINIHYNTEGYKKVAETIHKFISANE